MIDQYASFAICLVGIFAIIKFVWFLLHKDRKNSEAEAAINFLVNGFPPINKDQKNIQVNALLYQKILKLYQETCAAVKKGNTQRLPVFQREVRRYCLEHSHYLSKEIGETSFEFIDAITENLNKKMLSESRPVLDQHFIKISSGHLNKIKILIQEEMTQLKIH